MTTLVIVAMIVVISILQAIIVLQVEKLLKLAGGPVSRSEILNRINWLQGLREQADRSEREEIVRSRQEQTAQAHDLRCEVVSSLIGIGSSISDKVDALTGSNDHRFELLRSALENRIDSFTAECARNVHRLTQSFVASSASLEDELSARVVDFKSSLDAATKQTYTLHGQQSEAIASAIRAFQTGVDGKLSSVAQQLREEMSTQFKNLGDGMFSVLTGISQLQKAEMAETRNTVDTGLFNIQCENEKKLEQMRQTVDEKLQGTLEARLGESFKRVSHRLEQVYSGLGEMKGLAVGVGDLKRLLTNVKTRGTWGEVQLGAIIGEILTSDQFATNVVTSHGHERVEYAVKLPGRNRNDQPVWLPIDAKFPVEDYRQLLSASERGDVESVDRASQALEATLRVSAKNLSEKYLSPPGTTDFGILFLSTEGLYAEVMRRPGLAESVQREYRVVLAGPSTVAALLNALQIGFRTVAIERRSSEVWETLGAVKVEFSKYADVLARVKKKLGEAQNTIDNAETSTRAIQRRLKEAEDSEDSEPSGQILAEEDSDEIRILNGHH